MYRMTTHARATYTGVAAPGTSYAVRVPGAVGDQVRNLRVWVTVYSRGGGTAITVDVRHSDEAQAISYAMHTATVVNDSTASTGKLTGVINVVTNGMLGSYVEVVPTIVGAGSTADLQVTIEGNPF